MAPIIVLAFFAGQFIAWFGQSNLGVLMALQGAELLQSLGLPSALTILGVVLITALLNLFVGSALAKWALLAPIFVPPPNPRAIIDNRFTARKVSLSRSASLTHIKLV